MGLLAAATPEALASATQDLEKSCRGSEAGESFCLVMPRGVAVNSEIGVEANTKNYYLPLGATVGELIREAGVGSPDEVLPTLQVRRLFRGRPVRVDFDQLGIHLTQVTPRCSVGPGG